MKSSNALARLLLISLCLALLPGVPGTGSFAAKAQTPNAGEPPKTGLQFRLSEGRTPTGTPTPAPAPSVPARRLSDSATKKLLSRLPPLRSQPRDTEEFRLRPGAFPPPPIGQIIEAAFAPRVPDAPPVVESFAAPLEVLRYAPDGEVDLAPVLSITFSLPMVVLSAQSEAAAVVPVTLSPQPPGSWRWLGTQTLVFEPAYEGGRFPMATEYTVTIPAGIRSATGKTLAATKTFTFATPPPSVTNSYPTRNDQARDPVMFMQFDQRVDTAHLVENLRMLPESAHVQLRPATAEEIAADDEVRDLVKQAPEGRWIAFRAVDASGGTKNVLPADTAITVLPTTGVVSSEGPRIVTPTQALSFKTFAPLQVKNTSCRSSTCSPFDSIDITFNYSLDPESFSPAMVSVSPAIPEMKVTQGYNSINIEGVKQAGTTYAVTLNPEFKDTHGQTLSGTYRFEVAVHAAPARLFSTNERFIVLDPALRPTFNVYSVNFARLRVTLFAVTPEDWEVYRRYQEAFRRPKATEPAPPGRLVFEREIALTDHPDELTETAIDLSPALVNGHGQVFVRVDPVVGPEAPLQVYAYGGHAGIESWVQATDIGLDTFADNNGLTVWANSLTDGKPLAGVDVTLVPREQKGTTDAGGLVTLLFGVVSPPKQSDKAAVLVARRGDDVAIFPESYNRSYSHDGGQWNRTDRRDSISWFVFDDRKLYRPGEEVHVKGWIRRVDQSPRGDLGLPDTQGETVQYTLEDDQYDEVVKGSATLNPLGGFDLKLQLPAEMNLGRASLEFKLARNGAEYTHNFQVQEFRRPEFELKPEWSPGPDLVGSNSTAGVVATYFAGGPLPNADVKWEVRAWPTNFTPPNRSDFTFGKFQPWWNDERDEGSTTLEFSGKTDAQGRHTLRIDYDSVHPARPSFVRADATVQNVNRQTFSASIGYLVHPSSLYVGIKPARTFVQAGGSFEFSAIVTDLDGKVVAGRDVELRLERLEWVRVNGEWTERTTVTQERSIKSGGEALSSSLAVAEGGSYRLTARVRDDQGRANETEIPLWVAGGSPSAYHQVEENEVELIPDRRSYAAGEVAELLVRSPFPTSEGVLTLRRSGVLRS
jgi:hypothetical protein